jgi:PAS domain S-box-containing protein
MRFLYTGDDGREIWLSVTGSPLRAENGRIAGAVIAIEDIDAHTRSDQALREREQRYELVLAGAEAAIWDWDLINKRVVYSPQWKQLRGLADDEIGDNEEAARDRIHPEDYPRVRQAVIAHFKGQTPFYSAEYRVQHKDGRWLWILDRGLAQRDASGRVVRMAGSETNITERKQAEQEREARLAAEAANRAKSAFLARMSHELRTPLNAILGYAQLLQMDRGLSPRQQRGMETIRKSGEHLLQLIADLLDLSRIDTGHLELQPADIDLSNFLSEVADVARVKAAERSLVFRCDTGPGLPLRVQADEVRLRQVLLNLVGNALRFTDAGEVCLRVHATPAASGMANLLFEVLDTGIGIAAADRERIFRPFEQASDASRRAGGTGLGLAIAREIVRLMGGEINVDSTPGRGSRFWFELQLPVPAADPAQAARSSSIVQLAGAGRRVLVVDDVAVNRSVLVDLLTGCDFDVREAGDGEQALAAAADAAPDLILMDIAMPVMDGLEATRRLRQMPALSHVPIIAVSAGASASDRESSLAAGADEFITKPIDVELLLQQVGRLLKLEPGDGH